MTRLQSLRSRPGLVVLPALALALAGCGGGGGEDPRIQISTAPRVVAASAGADVTLANYTAQAAPMARAVLGATGNPALGAVGAGRDSPANAISVAARAPLFTAMATRTAVSHFVGAAGRKTVAAVQTRTAACPVSGTTTITANDANNNGKLDGGDSISISFSNCVIDNLTPPANGALSLQVLKSELDAQDIPTALSLAGSFTQLSVGTVARLDGNFTLTMTGCTPSGDCALMRQSYTDVNSVVGPEALVYRMDALVSTTTGTVAYELSGAIGWGGQVYALVPVAGQRLTLGPADATPTAGSLWLRDGAGDGLKLTARPGGLVDFGFYTAGNDTTPAGTWLGRTWSSFEQ